MSILKTDSNSLPPIFKAEEGLADEIMCKTLLHLSRELRNPEGMFVGKTPKQIGQLIKRKVCNQLKREKRNDLEIKTN